jgi:hypothetical protein
MCKGNAERQRVEQDRVAFNHKPGGRVHGKGRGVETCNVLGLVEEVIAAPDQLLLAK